MESEALEHDEEFKAQEDGLFEKDFRNSLNQVDLTFDTKTGKSITAYYGKGTNFDIRPGAVSVGG